MSSSRSGKKLTDPVSRKSWTRRRYISGRGTEGRSDMTLREFTDKRGVTWRVWDITPESLRELSRGAEYPARHYPADFYRTGWLSFQTLSGTDKRSLSPIPSGWEALSGPELADLVERATPGAPRKSRGGHKPPPTVTLPSPVEENSDPGRERAIVYPGGRVWTARVATPEQGGPPVLRFTSGGRSVDLAKWPSYWETLPDEVMIVLLRGVPRTGPAPRPDTPRRRWNDP